jgi:oxygen-independent coproporphyrinogen-3 oxidase
MAGLYLHIPFCKQACHYCDFHFSTSLGLKSRVVEAIARELELRRDYLGAGPRWKPSTSAAARPRYLRQLMLTRFSAAISPPLRRAERSRNHPRSQTRRPECRQAAGVAAERASTASALALQSLLRAPPALMNRAHTAAESTTAVQRLKPAASKTSPST